jgi:UDP-N-acetylglucosamine acyltransferase
MEFSMLRNRGHGLLLGQNHRGVIIPHQISRILQSAALGLGLFNLLPFFPTRRKEGSMANFIHPTAVIDPKAKLGDDNYIGPFCLIGPHVEIGSHNRFEAHISIGTAAEHRDHFKSEPGAVKIGNHCVIREFVTINGGTTGTTELGTKVTLLRGSHVGHDAQIRNFVNLSCNVLIGGHSIIGEGANLGLASVVHQMRVIGAYSMIGMSATVTKNTPPFVIAFGLPCELQRANRIGLQRSGIADSELVIFENWFQTNKAKSDLEPIPHLYQRFILTYQKDCASFNSSQRVAA